MNNHNSTSTILLTNIYDNYKQWAMFGCGNVSNDDDDRDSYRRKEQRMLHQLTHEVFATVVVLLSAVGYKYRSTIDIYEDFKLSFRVSHNEFNRRSIGLFYLRSKCTGRKVAKRTLINNTIKKSNVEWFRKALLEITTHREEQQQ